MAVNVTITSSYIIDDFYNRSGGGDIYVYSSGGSGTGTGGVGNLSELGDVLLSSLNTNDVLQYSNTRWRNSTPVNAANYFYSKAQVDASFALKTDIPSGVVKEASLGSDFVWVGGLLDVSIVTMDYDYVDGSLLQRDTSINRIDGSVNLLFTKNTNQDTSILVLNNYVIDLSTKTSYWKSYTDASLLQRDNSIANALSYVIDLSTKTSYWKTYTDGSLGLRDTSIANVLSYATDLSLNTLHDVSVVNASIGQFLMFDPSANTNKWKNVDSIDIEDYFATRSEIDYLATTNPSIGTYFDAYTNTWVGSGALKDVSQGGTYAGTGNTAIGYRALYVDTSGYQNTAVGRQALTANTYGIGNSAFGHQALYLNTLGLYNTAIGRLSLYNNVDGYYNTGVGGGALASCVSTHYNTAIGYAAGNFHTGSYLTAVGYNAYFYNTSGPANTGVGYRAGYKNTTGRDNVAIGSQTLYSSSDGSYNTAIGSSSLYYATTSQRNTAIGYAALHKAYTSYNTAIGYQAGRYVGSGTAENEGPIGSIYLGYQARSGINESVNEIVIGYNAVGAGSNTVTLGNTSCVSTYLRGTLYADGSAGFTGTVTAGQNMVFKNGILVQVI